MQEINKLLHKHLSKLFVLQFAFIALLFLIIVILIGRIVILNQKYDDKTPEPAYTGSTVTFIEPTGIYNANTSTTLVGFIRDSGLSSYQNSDLGFENTDFQITDFSGQYYDSEIKGFFLDIDSELIAQFNNQCVQLQGDIRELLYQDFSGDYHSDFLGRKMLTNIENVSESDECSKSHLISAYPDELTTLTGEINYNTQNPAPDIIYVYELDFDTPQAIENSSGNPINSINVIPVSGYVEEELLNKLGSEVTLEGYLVWSYAESRVFYVTDIR